jgi:hypothetical protein
MNVSAGVAGNKLSNQTRYQPRWWATARDGRTHLIDDTKEHIMYNSSRYAAEYLIAGNPGTPATLLRELAHSTEPSIRARVAENIATPVSALLSLANDHNREVKIRLADNESLPTVLLLHLVHDKDDDVRYSLAENRQMAPTILQILARDENPYVAHRAAQTLSRVTDSPFLRVAA